MDKKNIMAKQYVWNSDKEEFELVDVYEGVLAEFDRQDKAAAQKSVQADRDFWTCPECKDSNHKDLLVCGGCETPRRN